MADVLSRLRAWLVPPNPCRLVYQWYSDGTVRCTRCRRRIR